MKKHSRFLVIALALVMALFAFAGCTNSAASQAPATSSANSTPAQSTTDAPADNASGDFDFYIFNTKGENADALDAAVAAYEAETGLNIKTFSLGSGTPTEEALRADLASSNKPAIFSCMNPQALQEWVDGDFALELTSADLLPEFK